MHTPVTAATVKSLGGFFRSAAAMDGGFFLIMVAMPFKVLALGGGALQLGLVAAIGALTYIVCAPLAGRASDRVNRSGLCLSGGLVLIACAVAAWLIRRLDLLLALQVAMGLGKALYWPVVQATLGDLSPSGMRLRVLGRFNVAWSGGKTAGFVLGGLLLSACGFGAVLLAGAGCVAAAYLLLPRAELAAASRLAGRSSPPPSRQPDLPLAGAARLDVFRLMSWIANTAAYGAFGILAHHLPQWFLHHQWDSRFYGWFIGAILASQTLVLLALGGPLQLAWSARRLWLPQGLGLVAIVAIPLLTEFAALLVVAPFIGIACGVSYAASIYYSLEAPAARGRNAGIHEGLIGAGGFLPPLLAGILVRAGCGLSAPYLLAAALLCGSLLLQVGVYWRRRERV